MTTIETSHDDAGEDAGDSNEDAGETGVVTLPGPERSGHAWPFTVEPGTIVVFSDLSCAFAHLCVHRMIEARRRADVDVRFVHRHFILEEVNEFPIPKHYLESEIPQIAPLDMDAGWAVWHQPAETWPVSTLLAMEAVRAAEEQGPTAHEQLDRALRLAFFRDHRCITMRHVIVQVAVGCPDVDEDVLAAALDSGRHRAALMGDHASSLDVVQGSPHLFFADGTDVHNPGIELSWLGTQGSGYPRIDSFDESIHDELIRRAAV